MRDELFAAINTLKAKWWEVLFAKWFGLECISEDSGCVVTMYFWRDKFYLTDVQHKKGS